MNSPYLTEHAYDLIFVMLQNLAVGTGQNKMHSARAPGIARESQLQREAAEWNPPTNADDIALAAEEDIPVIDVGEYLEAKAPGEAPEKPLLSSARRDLAAALRDAGERTGFCYIKSFHSILSPSTLEDAFDATKKFHSLPEAEKMKYEMDNLGPEHGGLTGVGYLRERNKKLPARDKVNFNSCFVLKRELGPRNVSLDLMPWPESYRNSADCCVEFDGSQFRSTVIKTALALEQLSLALVPAYAEALLLPADYFVPSFESPLFRMRLTRYAPTPADEFGINPHVDTSFFTLLATTDHSGLVVFSPRKGRWVRARHVEGALIVNTGETLARITNDTWPATRHYVLHARHGRDRYSLPFFFNPTASARMAVVPTCVRDGQQPKYDPISYLEGQGVVQGE